MHAWWRFWVENRPDIYGVDAAILMNQKVWQASGHVKTFADPLVEDLVNHRRYRADHLLKDAGEKVDGLSADQLNELIKSKNIKSPDGNPLSEVRQFNMMFKSNVGATTFDSLQESKKIMRQDFNPALRYENDLLNQTSSDYIKDNADVAMSLLQAEAKQKMDLAKVLNNSEESDKSSRVYLRPETAQGIFTNYKNVVDSLYPDLPFGLAQQGKAFRNEISPRDFIFRSREFEQMEIEYFVDPKNWEEEFDKLLKDVHKFLEEVIGLPKAMIHELDVPAADRAHYSQKTIDIEFDYPIGREELMGLAYRTDFDLMNIQNATGKSMEYRPKDGSPALVPHVIEPSFGVERLVMAVLTAFYQTDEIGGDKRNVLRLPTNLAPQLATVSPLLKNKPELVKMARDVFDILQKVFPGRIGWDDSGNIGKRYRKADEIGVPACVVVDFDSLTGNDATVRDRDSAKQTRVKIDQLVEYLKKL
jgi:glycyl-tRNA synthetase